MSFQWFKNWKVNITWSPIFTAFYGTLMHLSADAYVVTILLRTTIVLTGTMLVLVVMRRLLPPAAAWAMTAWWTLSPINFDSLYEVHQFTVIPILLTWIAMLYKPGPWGRGLGIAGLLTTAILMRNEFLLATIVLALISVAWEIRSARGGIRLNRTTVLGYGIPLAIAFLVIGTFYSRAADVRVIGPMLQEKHTLNVCQVYAYGYQQRHNDWHGSPWTECQQLMMRDYGVPQPSLVDALRRNPRAMLEHFAWNLRLFPSGLQALLFNAMSGTVTPDYIPTPRSSAVLPISIATAGILMAGAYLAFRDRRYWWKFWLSDRAWGWLFFAAVACIVPAIVLTQRPRPSYLLVVGVALRAAIGMAMFVVAHRHLRFRVPAAISIALVLVLLIAIPPYYRSSPAKGRLVDSYRILFPFRQWVETADTGLVANGWAGDLCRYLGHSEQCRGMDFAALRTQVTSAMPMIRVFEANRATVFFADSTTLADPEARRFLHESAAYGWRTIAMRHDRYENWQLLVKTHTSRTAGPGEPPALDDDVREIVDRTTGIDLGRGWHDYEASAETAFRWVKNDAEIDVSLPGDGSAVLCFSATPGPSATGDSVPLQIYGNDVLLQTTVLRGRQIVRVQLPHRRMVIRLHATSDNRPVPNDSRILNFRVFRIWSE